MGKEQIIKLRVGMARYLPIIDEYSETLQRLENNMPATLSLLSHGKEEIKEAIEWWSLAIFLARHSEEMLTEISSQLGDEFKSSIMSDDYVDALNASYLSLAWFINDDDAATFTDLRQDQEHFRRVVEEDPSKLVGIAENIQKICEDIHAEFKQLRGGLRQKLHELFPDLDLNDSK
ncbi:MAG: hypothetical protein FVQ79_12595 [Planctomycetes bacterium]|nr:hypothetical protein [Planctomycetota bacterium]